MIERLSIFAVASLVMVVSACSPRPGAVAGDPFERANRDNHAFNKDLDRKILSPLSKTYADVVPDPVEDSVSNFASNLSLPGKVVNNVLQLDLPSAARNTTRFVLNSTVGVAGFLDVASSVGLRKNEEDFGQTLAAWGMDSGPYVMLPVFGASTVRDSFGLVIDTVFNPLQLVEDRSLRLGLFLLDETDSRSDVLALDELITGNRYLFIREAYLQRREYLINDGVLDDPFGDF